MITVDFVSYAESVPRALATLEAGAVFRKQRRFLIKPNLVTDRPHPVTTAPDCCRAVIRYLRSMTAAEIVIAEGCGDAQLTTAEVFERLGYTDLAVDCRVALVDLNEAPLRRLADEKCAFFPEIYLPEILFSAFVISLPVLKAHSLSEITGSLKNMMGALPPAHYSGQSGVWKKASCHADMHQAIGDLNRYRTPDLSLLDASIGLADYHLGGSRCEPPAGKLVAGFDPITVDRTAAGLLGRDWQKIQHLRKANCSDTDRTDLGVAKAPANRL